MDVVDEIDQHRRRFVSAAAIALAAAQLGFTDSAIAEEKPVKPVIKPGTNVSFGPLKQIDTDILNVGYVEAGAESDPAVILLHGWPYDIHSFVDVTPLLVRVGYRVIIQ